MTRHHAHHKTPREGGRGTPLTIHPRSSGLMRWAISASDNSVRRRKRNSRIFARMDFSAEGLTAGINLQNNELSREFRARRGRKQYPRKANLMFGYSPLRFPSLQ